MEQDGEEDVRGLREEACELRPEGFGQQEAVVWHLRQAAKQQEGEPELIGGQKMCETCEGEPAQLWDSKA